MLLVLAGPYDAAGGYSSMVPWVVGMGLCGVAWNLCFSSGTVMLSTCYRPEDAARVQGANDFVIFAIAGAGSFGSGFLFRAAGEQWQTGWRFLVWSVVGLMATLVALLLLFSILGRPRPQGGDGSPTDSTTTGGLGLLNSRSETGDADLLPRTGSVLSALSAVSAAASDVTRASVASEAMFVPPKETDDERPRTPPRRGWLDW